MKTALTYKKIVSTSAIILAALAGACDSGRIPVVPCPLGVEPDIEPKSDCKIIPQKSFVYCDEPAESTNARGEVVVGEPICRKESGSEAYSSSEARAIKIADKFYARAPEICNPSGSYVVDDSLEQLKADYDYNRSIANTVSTAGSNIRNNLIELAALHLEYGSIANQNAPNNFNYDDGTTFALPMKNYAALGILDKAGSESVADVILTRDLNVVRKRYASGSFAKLMAPTHYYCLPGPILGMRIQGDTHESTNTLRLMGLFNAGTDESRIPVWARFQQVNNGVGLTPGVTPMLGNIVTVGTTVLTLGGPGGMAELLKGLMDDNIVDHAGISTHVAFKADAVGATAKFGDHSKDYGNGLGGGSGSGSGGSGGGSGVGGVGSASGGGGADVGSGSGSSGLSAALANINSDAATEGKSGEMLADGGGKGAEYSGSSGGGGKKGGGSPMDAFSGLFGAKGGAGGTGLGGASSLSFGKAGAAGPMGGGTLSDADFEAMLKLNSASSLFEIANRRYFKWGSGVLGAEEAAKMRAH